MHCAPEGVSVFVPQRVGHESVFPSSRLDAVYPSIGKQVLQRSLHSLANKASEQAVRKGIPCSEKGNRCSAMAPRMP